MNIEKTQLKLDVSKRSGVLVGFVYRHAKTRKLLGVREDAPCGKKICLLSDKMTERDIRPNKLYHASVTAMHNGNGYVIVDLQPIEFPAQIELKIIPKRQYQITITFGNKTIYFDPINGRSPSSSTLDGVIKLLEDREDIQHKQQVIEDLIEQSRMLNRIMNKDKFQLPSK